MNFELTTPERVVYQAKARQVTLPTSEGEITVLPGHVPLVAPVEAGELRVVAEDGSDILMAVSGGFVTVKPDGIVVLADTAERGEELELAAIEEAKRKAEALLKEKITDAERFADTTAHLARELARLKVARKHASRKHHQ
jgi:F-type H+-transporting ATPase subunit epsilon